MKIFDQWTLVNFIANKDYGGNIIEPDRFNQLAKLANLDLFKLKMGLPEEYQLGAPLSRQYLDATQRLTDETRFLKKRIAAQTVTTGVVAYPSDYFTFNTMRYGFQRTIDGEATVLWKSVEVLTEDQYSDRAGNWTKQPATKNPVCVIRNDGIYVYPTTIPQVDFSYIRYPVEPEFVYVQQAGYITEGACTEFEWPIHLHRDLTMMILSFIGINIREQQLEQYAEMHKEKGV
ncbi:MAG: hypothetical protein IMZ64_13880 [Bacteroidetes bacterium]|nr:hypothetical protein [Bacteroidota bacterium]